MRPLYRFRFWIAALFAVMTVTAGCNSNSTWDELPSEISQFISRYFPEQGVSDFGESDGIYHVKIRGGAALSFNREYQWTTINGYGSTLPQMLLFDQLPPALYEYIQSLGALEQVYSLHRDPSSISVSLLSSTLTYDRRTARITET